MHDVIVDVAGVLASSLGLEEHSLRDWPCQFRINRYNYTQDTVGSSGVQIHTDSSFLTVLQEDECVGGLEVSDPATGEFVPVDPVAGSFPHQHRGHRHGVEQREAAQREAPGAVRRAGAAHLHRHFPARAQGRQRERAGAVRGRGPPVPVQGDQLRRLPGPPAVHRRARRRGARAVGGVTWARWCSG
ncbi:hypothetical protein PVAP13_7KG203600 [Panicum virgatum]|uniref:Isopenicillin N synthase-like Fe(2+) 2OG dioxygenase domain-containing protein n=1 Tax=Panicum virgatum TaxID=38727 RepID=A0A8T0QI04_PANVG|nr:hypothetical protein PVAP13_7KG203600 [Panicum virgatum]